MSDYSRNDPKGWCGDPTRGAALGRKTIEGTPDGVITVRLSPLDRQGYDRNGTYFGVGDPLYWYADEGGEVDGMLRAAFMADALTKVRAKFPGAPVIDADPLPLPCFGAGEDPCPSKADAMKDGLDLCEECEITEMCSHDDAEEDA
jgi:hypothetical protein